MVLHWRIVPHQATPIQGGILWFCIQSAMCKKKLYGHSTTLHTVVKIESDWRVVPSPYSSFPGWSTWLWVCQRTDRLQRRPPWNRTPGPCGGCSSHPGSRTGRRALGLAARGRAGRNPSSQSVSNSCPHPGGRPRLCYHRTEPKPHTGSRHS